MTSQAKLAGALALLFALSSGAARSAPAAPPQPDAAPLPARVHMTVARSRGAEGCPALDELTTAVEQRLGRSVFVSKESADLRAEVRARRSGRSFVIDVDLFDASGRALGRRRLSTRARHCSALDDSLALVVSLVADVARPAPPDPAIPPEPQAAPAPLAPLATPVDVPETTLAPREPMRLRPALGIAVGAGLLPRASLGVSLGVELVFARFWPLWLQASYWGEQRVGADGDAEARFGLQTLRLGVCPWSARYGDVELDICGEQMFGRQQAQGFGFVRSQPGDRWVAAFGAGAGVKYWLGRSFVAASGTLLVSAVQRRYYFVDVGEVTLHDTSWVLGIGTIAVGFEL